MKITIAKVGSRGDVQPYVALGRGLQSAGHQVQIATDPMFQGFIEAAGLVYASVAADLRTALQEEPAATLCSERPSGNSLISIPSADFSSGLTETHCS